ncbi:MAG: malonic semialdehyde reductase [Pseudomonadota bacterium]
MEIPPDLSPHVNRVAKVLFTEARTPSRWLPRSVSDVLLRDIFELARFGPTSMNTQPLRVQFVSSAGQRARLAGCVNPGNVEKINGAPVVAVIGQDLAFADHLGTLFAHKVDARAYYDGKPDVVASTALRNSSLQGAYLMMAARLLGLDCGPMSGFNAAAVDEMFWAGTAVRTNFLCCLGHGDFTEMKPRNPRLTFDEVCRII